LSHNYFNGRNNYIGINKKSLLKKDITIIGAGIVGLSTAYKILEQKPGLKVRILEKEQEISKHQTGNNSGVIHSGIYYMPGSLKAKNCIHGYKLLLDFCDRNDIEYDICGKIIVAVEENEIHGMESLYKRGIENGLEGLKLLKKEELKDFEPHVSGLAGIRVPQTGIIDFKKVSEKLADDISGKGVEIHFNQKVTGIDTENKKAIIKTASQSYESKIVINCAGLYSDKIARFSHKDVNVKIIPFRGEYYKIKPEKKHLVKNLIYPVPDPNFPFLGVHYTRMIDGGIEAGPNAVLAFAREGYKKSQINPAELLETLTWPGFLKVASKYWKTGFGEMYRSFSKKAFTRALQKLIPEIHAGDLETGGAGVRAQACDRSGGLLDDFLIYESEYAINVCNAPSPAATSCLAIGETIAILALKRFS
jgi:L-2-hydroxyglutarate oxidase